MGTAVINPASKRRASDYIRHLPARNLHHGIRLAESKGLTLNTFVSLNFSLTDCAAPETDISFQKLRTIFTKWVTRPPKDNNTLGCWLMPLSQNVKGLRSGVALSEAAENAARAGKLLKTRIGTPYHAH